MPDPVAESQQQGERSTSESSEMSERNDEELHQTRRYRGMLEHGVPRITVHHKMVCDGLDPGLVDFVLKRQQDSVAEMQEHTGAERRDDVALKTYRGMLKAGIPPLALIRKMEKDGISPEQRRQVIAVPEQPLGEEHKVEEHDSSKPRGNSASRLVDAGVGRENGGLSAEGQASVDRVAVAVAEAEDVLSLLVRLNSPGSIHTASASRRAAAKSAEQGNGSVLLEIYGNDCSMLEPYSSESAPFDNISLSSEDRLLSDKKGSTRGDSARLASSDSVLRWPSEERSVVDRRAWSEDLGRTAVNFMAVQHNDQATQTAGKITLSSATASLFSTTAATADGAPPSTPDAARGADAGSHNQISMLRKGDAGIAVADYAVSSSGSSTATSLSHTDDDQFNKYKIMLKRGVPCDAVWHKMTADGMSRNDIATFISYRTKAGDDLSDVVEEERGDDTDDERALAKFRMMRKVGLSVDDVRQKMSADGFEHEATETACGRQSTTMVALSADKEILASKYRSMMKAGVPEEAVRHKMRQDGVAVDITAAVCGLSEDPKCTTSLPDMQLTALSPEDEAQVAKFRGMLKAGVPNQAVRNKMGSEGIDIKLIFHVCGGDRATGAQEPKKCPTGASLPHMAARQSPPSNLVTIHWTPLRSLSADDLKKSVWAKGRRRQQQVGGAELDKLRLLFAKKEVSQNALAANSPSKSNSLTQPPKRTKNVSALDNVRQQNISIGLRSFKNLDPGAIGEAVGSLSMAVFGAEHLARLEEMLPTDAEVRVVEQHVLNMRCLAGQDETGVNQALEPPESFCMGFASVQRPRSKLAVLHLMVTFESRVVVLLASFSTLRRTFQQISESDKLATLLCKVGSIPSLSRFCHRPREHKTGNSCASLLVSQVLEVGNIMNAGTAKGEAQGITVDSLLKLTQTKSTCNNGMTVLDFVVDLLSGLTSENAAADTSGHPLDFHLDIPFLEEVSRLPLSELNSEISDLNAALTNAELELSKLRGEAAAAPVEERQTPTSKSSEKAGNVESSDPRGSLMAMLHKRAGGYGKATEAASSTSCQQSAQLPDSLPGAAVPGEDAAPADPRANLLAMLQKRGGDASSVSPTKTKLTASQSRGGPASSDKTCLGGKTDSRKAWARAAGAVSALTKFLGEARGRMADARSAADETRMAAEELALFFGDEKQDVGQIFICLLRFSVMVKDARKKATKRAKDEAHEKPKIEKAARLLSKKRASALPCETERLGGDGGSS